MDPRYLPNGWEIPREHYCDQPYTVVLPDGAWLCVLTTGRGVEGEPGQHVISTRSTDQGRTWSAPVDIEPADGPEASWVMPLLTDFGRVYAFYVYNTHNQREVISDDGPIKRVDSFGDLMCRYTDDGGLTWSPKRYHVPIREFACDRRNAYGGKVQFFWGVGKPITDGGQAFIGLSKVHGFGYGFFTGSEGIFLRSDNVLTERDADQVVWDTLPEGEVGLVAPGGPIAEEHNLTALADGSLCCTYRTIDGFPCHAYSRDRGNTWTAPEYMTYGPGGRRVKHPRAANFVWQTGDGRFLYWFHNHGGKWYDDRNPVWLLGGIERDGFIHWSEPEVVLYDDDPSVRISYPCFVEDGGGYYLTETQKVVARVHQVDPALLEGAWASAAGGPAELTREGLVVEAGPDEVRAGSVAAPKLPRLDRGGGFTIDLHLRLDNLGPCQVLVDSRDAEGRGLVMATTDDRVIELRLSDGQTAARWDCDSGVVRADVPHHVSVIVDGGPKLISFVVDGRFCDGGTQRQFGWGRFSPWLRGADGGERLRLAPALHGELRACRVYARALRTAEVVANHRAESGGAGS